MDKVLKLNMIFSLDWVLSRRLCFVSPAHLGEREETAFPGRAKHFFLCLASQVDFDAFFAFADVVALECEGAYF